MPKISVLPDHIASQIAAGEVIERPSSVVKEFVENSIDAGATKIEIAVSSDCRDIRVADNGCGMEKDDAVLAFQRHATSKLKSADDLWRLNSLGFRGEALPSIASVSRLSCITRTAEALSGSRVSYENGLISAVETGCAPGTIMEITDLFFNVPARLSFLKKPATEFGHIQETIQSLAIAHPEVAFSLLRHDEIVLRSSGSSDLRQTLVEVGHFNGREDLIAIQSGNEDSEIELNGFIARPLHFRGDRKGIVSIVNKRPVRCPLTYRALDYSYSDLIPRGKYPLAVLHTRIDPARVDVNVHPSKKELRYTDGNDTYVAIQRAIAQALRDSNKITRAVNNFAYEDSISAPPHLVREHYSVDQDGVVTGLGDRDGLVASLNNSVNISLQAVENSEGLASIQQHHQRAAKESFSVQQMRLPDISKENSQWQNQIQQLGRQQKTNALTPTLGSETEDAGLNGKLNSLPSDWRIAGYVHNTYVFIETKAGLEIVEQHIAHERTLYERILARQINPGRVTEDVQHLLVTVPLDLSPEQLATLDANYELLNNLGFDFKRDIAGKASATQVPLELSGKNYGVVIQELLEQIRDADSANLQLEATKSLACQAAIKNGMPLSPAALEKLLIDWLNTPRNDTCPHGRPIRMKYSLDRLFQIFHP